MPASEHLEVQLRGWANQIAARFGAPVYLIGSSLTEDHPRDVDIVVILQDIDFNARYGSDWDWQTMLPDWSEGALRWAADCAKLAQRVARAYNINVDFKVQPETFARHRENKPRLRLDRVGVPEAI